MVAVVVEEVVVVVVVVVEVEDECREMALNEELMGNTCYQYPV